jgi:hypothetical protein
MDDQISYAEPPANQPHQWALALLYVLYAFGFRGEGGGMTIIPEDKWNILYDLAGGAPVAPEIMHDALSCIANVHPEVSGGAQNRWRWDRTVGARSDTPRS